MTAGRRGAGRSGAAALLAAAALALGGCSSGPPQPSGGPPTTLAAPSGPVDAGAEQSGDPAAARYYAQAPQWVPCEQGLECATVRVPVDWADPAGQDLGLAVARWPATEPEERAGALLVNPGGPGASGVAWVRRAGRGVVSPAVAARYDVVGFDPRGVGSSSPVDCVSDAELDAQLAGGAAAGSGGAPSPDLQELRRDAEAFAAGCAERTGPLLAHVDTASAARDLDVLRAVLGSQRLHYLGKSYGAQLGATYADLFPQRVGRLVLDGALDPAASYVDVAVEQAEGLEGALRAYAEDCPQRSGCPLAQDPEAAVEQVRDVLEAARTAPLPTGTDRPLTAALATTGVVAALYDDASWPALDEGLARAQRDDGSVLLRMADAYADRRPDGTYASNIMEAFHAVTCLDHPVDASAGAVEAAARRVEAASPTFGASLARGEVLCGVWPAAPVGAPGPVTAEGAAPVLVVGTTGDPATPYAWSQALADQLSSGRLLTWDGEGHTAYRRGSACVDAAVDGYLLDGVLPGEGATCG
ncbi:alpha/beta hydrolase [Quadrisphaera sp. DSM 44207]|uniref:alpha/beta hydrolase n=1 Tax=Quadrisphaera sp. DSM 44207 TaxID=1881057 RepID=UPI000880BB8E|nr:alpha/beta hydrolase [Quadrisphaera sp. DSM 44207]SDQ17445.1 alpha/beta hydrolase fold [Quadrisphaera sp. DSM 44207]